jgi:hypothetical protein
LKRHRPRDPFSECRRLEVVLPCEGEPHQGPTQSVKQRKPPLSVGSRRRLRIHARNSAVPTASGNAHSTIQASEPGSPLPDRISKKAKNKKPLRIAPEGLSKWCARQDLWNQVIASRPISQDLRGIQR